MKEMQSDRIRNQIEVDEWRTAKSLQHNSTQEIEQEALLQNKLDETGIKVCDRCKSAREVIACTHIPAYRIEVSKPGIWSQFDQSFLVVIIICNFTQGFKQFLDLSLLNLYKDIMKLEPAEVQAYMGIIAIPWSFKIVYGFMSDNLTVFNSKRRGHILLNCSCCILSMSAIMAFGMQFGKYFVTFMIFVSQINMAYNDTVTDALTCQASKLGVEDGTENLNTLSYLLQGIGAIAGAMMAEYVTDHKDIGPFQCFGVYLIL